MKADSGTKLPEVSNGACGKRRLNKTRWPTPPCRAAGAAWRRHWRALPPGLLARRIEVLRARQLFLARSAAGQLVKLRGDMCAAADELEAEVRLAIDDLVLSPRLRVHHQRLPLLLGGRKLLAQRALLRTRCHFRDALRQIPRMKLVGVATVPRERPVPSLLFLPRVAVAPPTCSSGRWGYRPSHSGPSSQGSCTLREAGLFEARDASNLLTGADRARASERRRDHGRLVAWVSQIWRLKRAPT